MMMAREQRVGLWDFSSQGGGGRETSPPSCISGSAGNSLSHWEAQSFNRSDKAVFSIDTGRVGFSRRGFAIVI